MVKAKTIAEYAIRKWLQNEGFAMECFSLRMDGQEAVLTDSNGDKMRIIYNPATKTVLPVGMGGD